MADPHFESVICLLPLDTDLSDVSNSNLQFTANRASIIAGEGPFAGTGALYVDGSQSWISALPPDTHLLSTDDFTVELWAKVPNNSTISGDGLIAWHNRNNTKRCAFGVHNYNSEGLMLSDSSSSLSYISQGSSYNGGGAWNHLAATRSNDTFRLFINGNVVSTSVEAVNINIMQLSSGWQFDIGRYWYSSDSNSGYFTGYISNVRITKGIARYTENFTPPTEAFPTAALDAGTLKIAGTVQLDGTPQAGAVMRLYDHATGAFKAEETTDASGDYEFVQVVGGANPIMETGEEYDILCHYGDNIRPLVHGPVVPLEVD